ncbi:MAG: LLM class flavin-dependent oxidoreductase [Gammaproteobacteria bacterium]|nr:LLM class flavin-dependent oxidoreductase [Gammaproteobacteria bacterium]
MTAVVVRCDYFVASARRVDLGASSGARADQDGSVLLNHGSSDHETVNTQLEVDMLPVGYFPCTQDATNGENVAGLIAEIIEQARLCEDVGFDGFYFAEHHQQDDCFLPAPVLLAGLIAMRTRHIKVGTCVLLAPLYHPIRLAEDIAVIDLAAEGRFAAAAVGIGYQPNDFNAFGVSIKERARRTEECIEILREAWSGKRFSYPGRYHAFEDIRVSPVPYQRGGPPIWLAAWSPPGMERAGRMADGWIADPIQSLPVIRDYAASYRETAAANGRKPYVVLMRDCIVGKDRAAVVAKSVPTMTQHRWYFENGAYVLDDYLKDVDKPDDLTFDICAQDRLIAGSREECVDQLQMWRDEIQPDYLIVRLRQTDGPPQAEALEDIRVFGESIIPRL